MSTRRYALDPELLPMADSLPAVMELGNPAVIAAMRSGPALSGTAAPDRSDVRKEDRLIPGRAGDPDIVPTASTGFTAAGAATDNSTYNYVILEVN